MLKAMVEELALKSGTGPVVARGLVLRVKVKVKVKVKGDGVLLQPLEEKGSREGMIKWKERVALATRA